MQLRNEEAVFPKRGSDEWRLMRTTALSFWFSRQISSTSSIFKASRWCSVTVHGSVYASCIVNRHPDIQVAVVEPPDALLDFLPPT
jgi:hypothetical protein